MRSLVLLLLVYGCVRKPSIAHDDAFQILVVAQNQDGCVLSLVDASSLSVRPLLLAPECSEALAFDAQHGRAFLATPDHLVWGSVGARSHSVPMVPLGADAQIRSVQPLVGDALAVSVRVFQPLTPDCDGTVCRYSWAGLTDLSTSRDAEGWESYPSNTDHRAYRLPPWGVSGLAIEFLWQDARWSVSQALPTRDEASDTPGLRVLGSNDAPHLWPLERLRQLGGCTRGSTSPPGPSCSLGAEGVPQTVTQLLPNAEGYAHLVVRGANYWAPWTSGDSQWPTGPLLECVGDPTHCAVISQFQGAQPLLLYATGSGVLITQDRSASLWRSGEGEVWSAQGVFAAFVVPLATQR